MASQESPNHPAYPPGFPSAHLAAGAAASLTFFITGKPEPKGRPRARSIAPKDGSRAYIHIYTDETTATWEQHVEIQIREQLVWISRHSADDQVLPLPLHNRVLLAIRFNLPRPTSIAKKVRFPVKARSDVDNLAKAVMDAMANAGILSNDNIVTDLMTYKRYADEAHPQGVEIDVTGLL